MSDQDQPQPEAPLADIPDLKKKKEERKKSGVAAEFGGDAGNTFNGARGAVTAGSRAAASAAARTVATEAVEVAESVATSQGGLLARLLGSPLFQAFGRFAGTLIGKVVLGLAAAMVTMAIGAMLRGGSPSAKPGNTGAPSFADDIKSTIRVHMPSNKGLDYAARASNGALKFGDAKKTAAAPTPPPAAPAPQAAPMPEGKDADFASSPDMPHGNFQALSGAKLSSGFGGGASGASFGKNDVFGSGPKIASVDRGKIANFAQGVNSSARGGLQRGTVRGSRAIAFRGGRTSKGMAQLRGMGPNSLAIRNALTTGTGEAASAAATQQWEGSAPTAAAPAGPEGAPSAGAAGGGGGGGGPSGLGDTNVPTLLHPPVDISACTQDQINNGYTISSDNSSCTAPANAGNTNDTPWQKYVDIANDLNIAAGLLNVISGVFALIANGVKAVPVFGWAMFVGWANLALVMGVLAAVCSLGAIGCSIAIMSMGGGMQGFGTLMGSLMNGVMSALAIVNAFTGVSSGSIMAWMPVILGFLGSMSSLVPMLMSGGPDPNANLPKTPIQDMGMLPPPPAGEHWESKNPNDPNPKDYQLVPDGNPPGNAPPGTQWAHDPTDNGWSLVPANQPNGSDGKPLPALPPGQHYENGQSAQDGMAPYSPPAGDHWEHQNVPNSDPNAWVLYNGKGQEVGHSAGVDPNGEVYTVNTQGPNETPAGAPAGSGSQNPQKDPNYPSCNTQKYVTNASGQNVPNPNCGN